MRAWCAALLAFSLTGAAWARDYVDPDGGFALALPADWQANRGQAGELGTMTQCGVAGDQNPPLSVLVVTSAQPIAPERLPDVAKLLLGVLHETVRQNATLAGERTAEARLDGRAALRSEFTYQAPGGPQFAGRGTVVLGRTHALLVFATWPQDKAALRDQVDAVLATLAVEGAEPRAAGGGVFNPRTLGALAGAVKGNLQRDPAGVLAAGQPALTNLAVLSFAQLLSDVFGVELSEAEYALVQEQFVTSYQQADANGKTILVGSGQAIVAGLRQGTETDRARRRQEVREVMETRFKGGAQAGIPWARAVWQAIERRRQTVCRTDATRPASPAAKDFKSEVTEADLDAAVELLGFMWLAAGRDATAVTPAVVQQVRAGLAQNYPRFPAQLQYLLANAQTVYSRVRQMWMTANAAQRAQLAQEFSRALDDLGLKDPAKGGGAWSNVDTSNLTGELVVNTCYNLSQRATGGAWPSSAPRSPWGGG